MGSRKRNRAEELKEIKKKTYYSKLNNCPTSPRKMRLVADLIRGVNVDKALTVLKHSSKEASGRLHKLLLSAIANWQSKNEGARIEDSNLYIKEINVDGGRILKRIQPAPQGRAHRIKKRSNHVTLIIDSRATQEVNSEKKAVKNQLKKEEIVEAKTDEPKIKKTRTKKETKSKTNE